MGGRQAGAGWRIPGTRAEPNRRFQALPRGSCAFWTPPSASQRGGDGLDPVVLRVVAVWVRIEPAARRVRGGPLLLLDPLPERRPDRFAQGGAAADSIARPLAGLGKKDSTLWLSAFPFSSNHRNIQI